MFNKRALGNLGEEKAVQYLTKNKYKILERNYRSNFGEVDIIAKENEDLVFIEVKLRRTNEFGLPIEAITGLKQKRIVKSALQYVKSKNLLKENIRFDVLLIGPQEDEIEVVKSAFSTDGFYKY
ncbi:MAG: YraN family protein [Elusimicrobia bacterium]|nr:YraN family protein [Candidatus Liberimonas magnetica]